MRGMVPVAIEAVEGRKAKPTSINPNDLAHEKEEVLESRQVPGKLSIQ